MTLEASRIAPSAADYLQTAEQLSTQVPGVDGALPREIVRAAVIGAGTMGSSIAISLANAGITVDLLERDADAAKAGQQRVSGLYHSLVKRGRLSEADALRNTSRIRTGHDWSVIADVDLVIEAAFEDMAVKKDIFRRLDGLAKPGAVLATNTSYLDIDEIAAATSRASDVVGLHFFSPAHIMRLLEVVRGAYTAPDILATALTLGRRIRKLPIYARNGDGFIGNRIFAVYRRHAEYLLEDGASLDEIDRALVAFGFAMGPFAVADMSGLDVAWAMRKRRAPTRDPNERYAAIADRLCEAGRLGRKTGGGWYDYEDGKAKPSPVVETIVADERVRRGITPKQFVVEDIQRRILAVMANEGAKVLSEGISLRPSDIDLVFTNGYGFPRAKGGPMFVADQLGLTTVLAEVREAGKAAGAGSEPADLLVQLEAQGSSFASWQEDRAGA
ncbi:3-hydroxyacyl-CoA dehydrogenase [Xanthobacter autotrophicus]|uniref:3-hydroxyacyl-CoA dehydrogenase n=1 Tax=Xanthobacter autotrophicus TaxID=280 RepID=UPI00372962A1